VAGEGAGATNGAAAGGTTIEVRLLVDFCPLDFLLPTFLVDFVNLDFFEEVTGAAAGATTGEDAGATNGVAATAEATAAEVVVLVGLTVELFSDLLDVVFLIFLAGIYWRCFCDAREVFSFTMGLSMVTMVIIVQRVV
ncbi:MAG: hypothetical protein ACI90V_012921, partial [Bacillariaceae sp.]|jgi:hypothetical protein